MNWNQFCFFFYNHDEARKSTTGIELDWSNNSSFSGVKTLVHDFGEGKFSTLTRLYLSGCGLSRLPDNFENLPLETLSLESNKFKEFPGSLTKMKTLKCLYLRYEFSRLFSSHDYLSDNMIKKIPHNVRDLTNLRYLWLQHNKLKEISTQICRIKNLKVGFVTNWITLNRNRPSVPARTP